MSTGHAKPERKRGRPSVRRRGLKDHRAGAGPVGRRGHALVGAHQGATPASTNDAVAHECAPTGEQSAWRRGNAGIYRSLLWSSSEERRVGTEGVTSG